ncbi:hypothetical protein [Enterobacter sp.]|uniref:hypothetical protein n=1 Tax=Enterobacter sp. TaxID=42895 RepID=UPI00296F8990|nr:hypothetical protein [Enterobacter sp.]
MTEENPLVHSDAIDSETAHLRTLISDEVSRQLQAAWLTLGKAQESVSPEVMKEEPVADSLRCTLSPLLTVLDVLRRDSALEGEWLRQPLPVDEGEQIQQFLAISSHWERIERLWDILARRAKAEGRAASGEELMLLEFTLSVHNRLWVDRFAQLEQVDVGCAYNFEIHNGTGHGEHIAQLWLPGLISNTGQRRRKPLVELQA